jgi:Nucleotide modification associated domain 3
VNALLVRVGADLSAGGGLWNGPVDSRSYEFVYVPIPETKPVRAGMEKPYRSLVPALSKFGVSLPPHLTLQHMHLDPDFDYLTYGDQGERAKQLLAKVGTKGDIIVFYAGLKDARVKQLTYAIIGLFFVDEIVLAARMPSAALKSNAHSRRILPDDAQDIVVRASPKASGRLQRCIPFGEWRDGAYRVRRDILEAWGGLSVKDGFLQRSARLPEIRKPESFLHWLHSQAPVLLQANN